ncbi:hypothetical protein RU639_008382 [Aspergillus parasiticus]
MKKVLISGGAGFVDRKPPGPDHTLPDGVESIKVDVTIQEEVRKAIELEGHVRRPNVGETEHNLQTAKQSGVKGFIYTSCCVVTDQMDAPYHNIDEQWPTPPPSLIYGESKAAAEAMVLKESSDTMAACSLRPSVLCGPGDDRLVPAIQACIAKVNPRSSSVMARICGM